MIKLISSIFVLIVLLYSCKEEEYEPFVFAGIPKADMFYYEYNPPLQIQFQTDSLEKIKYGIDSIDIDSDGRFDFFIIQRINLSWNDKLSRHLLEDYNFPYCGITLKNGLEVACKGESFPTGLGTSSGTLWVDSLSPGDRIDKIIKWHHSTWIKEFYMGYYNNTLWMCGAPPAVWWGRYGFWHYLSNTEKYIGLRWKINSIYKFGWIKVKVNSQDNFEILSYAIEI